MPTHTPEHQARNAAEQRRRRPQQDTGQRDSAAQSLIQQQVDRRVSRRTAPQGSPPFVPETGGGSAPFNPNAGSPGIDIMGSAPQGAPPFNPNILQIPATQAAPSQLPAQPQGFDPRTEFDVMLNTVPGSELQQQELARVRAQPQQVVSPGLQAPLPQAPGPVAAPVLDRGPLTPEDVEVDASGQDVMQTLQQNPALVQQLRALPPESRAQALQNLLMNRMRVRQLSSVRVV